MLIMNRFFRFILFAAGTLLLGCGGGSAHAQESFSIEMGLGEVIATAHEQSPSAVLARHNFVVSYWQYRTYKAQYLPSLNLQGSLGQYNRSFSAVQSSETGEINYVSNNNMRNSLGLSIDQNIPFTGGSLSVITSLSRLDQFSPLNKITYNSAPINISYNQPINGYNSLKWEKKIEPKKYELAKRNYIETMEAISVTAVGYFFDLLIAQNRVAMAIKSRDNTRQLYNIAKERFNIGSITKDELLQLELRLLNDDISIRDNQISEGMAMRKLRTYLGYNESVKLVLKTPEENPQFTVSVEDVMARVWENSSDILNNEINSLSAEKAIAQAKANSGLKASLYAQFGLNQVAEGLDNVYKSPLDQEVVGLTLSVPIIDWGLGRGRVKVAKSQAQVIESQIEKSINTLRENIALQVMQFNLQGPQCEVSRKAADVGLMRYNFAKERFMNGSIGVTDLNTAQSEMDNANLRYLEDLSNYWKYYHNIQQMTLYDYVKGHKIEQNFEELSKE